MTSAIKHITLQQIMVAIESQQPIINKAQLSGYIQDNTTPTNQLTFTGIASLISAKSSQVSFLADKAYHASLLSTDAGLVLVAPEFEKQVPDTAIALVVTSPYLAYASISSVFAFQQTMLTKQTCIHPTAQIEATAYIGEGVTIGAYCVIGAQVSIGAGSRLHTHVVIDEGAKLGESCILDAHVHIAHHCELGNEVRVHSHASIGSEGFGFAPTADPASLGWVRIAQLGRVIIGNHVRIGSQTCIDRGAIDDTFIDDNVIIDNLVQIAHNVRIGAGTAIAATTGIAGSTHIGKRCIIGGAVGISGHLTITDDVSISGMSMVTKSIKHSGAYSSGTAVMPTADWRRAAVKFRQMGKK